MISNKTFIALFVALSALLTSPENTFAQFTAPRKKMGVASKADMGRIREEIRALRELGYWTAATDSIIDPVNRQAIIAFQKMNGLKRTGAMSNETILALVKAQAPIVKDSLHLPHLEIDLNRQVLFEVDSLDRVKRILSVSTGNGQYFETPERGGRYARTPRGKFNVYYKVEGWRKSELGSLYYPLYIVKGVAIHGALAVPATPASHGCIRIPMFAAEDLFLRTPVGMPVLVYGENPKSKG